MAINQLIKGKMGKEVKLFPRNMTFFLGQSKKGSTKINWDRGSIT